MVVSSWPLDNWRGAVRRWLRLVPTDELVSAPATVVPLTRSALDVLAQADYPLPPFVQECAVAQKYRTLLGTLPWHAFPERNERQRPWPGPRPQARAPFVAALLVQLVEQKKYHSDLRAFLIEHPALVWLLGFELLPDPRAPHGFDVAASVPTRRRFGAVVRTLPRPALQFLLDSTVTLLRETLPAEVAATFGQTVSGDTKHILAWVKENNPKAFIKEGRYDKTRQPAGDPDCKLGVKKKRNSSPSAAEDASAPPGATPASYAQPGSTLQPGDEIYWGYASGVIATKIPDWGEVVLAERTDTFDRADVTYFQPLLADTQRRLGQAPRYGAFDAAFDAWYVYDYFHQAGGFAAVPFVAKGSPAPRHFDAEGRLLCEAGLPFAQRFEYQDRTTSLVPQTKAKWVCPLLFPQASGATCPITHAKWDQGGCATTLGTSPGARLRYTLDRKSDEYTAVYRQRTADERINAQAKELGIERPYLRNRHSITNRNTLIYVLINLKALHRFRAQRAAQSQEGLPLAS